MGYEIPHTKIIWGVLAVRHFSLFKCHLNQPSRIIVRYGTKETIAEPSMIDEDMPNLVMLGRKILTRPLNLYFEIAH